MVKYVEEDIEQWKKIKKTVSNAGWVRKAGSYGLGFGLGGPIGAAVAASIDGCALVLDVYESVSNKKIDLRKKIYEWKIDQAFKLLKKLGKETKPITEFLERLSNRLDWKH